MTVRAFVLIQTEIEVAKTADVVAALKKLGSEVQSVDRVTGPCDTIVVHRSRHHGQDRHGNRENSRRCWRSQNSDLRSNLDSVTL